MSDDFFFTFLHLHDNIIQLYVFKYHASNANISDPFRRCIKVHPEWTGVKAPKTHWGTHWDPITHSKSIGVLGHMGPHYFSSVYANVSRATWKDRGPLRNKRNLTTMAQLITLSGFHLLHCNPNCVPVCQGKVVVASLFQPVCSSWCVFSYLPTFSSCLCAPFTIYTKSIN